jgi:hypothetical protein
MSPDISRRDILALGAVGAVGVAAYGSGLPTSSSAGSGTTSSSTSDGLRWRQLRPVIPGGASISVPGTDAVGSAAAGVRGPAGPSWLSTCRHVVDPDYPDSDREDVIGTAVYQAGDTDVDPIGTVVDCSRTSGVEASDWAVVGLESDDLWTSLVVGAGSVSSRYQTESGDRLVMAGLRTGVHGVEVTETGIAANFRGSMVNNVIEYVVDDNVETAGNSGAWVGWLDPQSGEFRPVGIHAFRVDDERYAVPVEECLDEPGASLESGTGERPTVPDLDGPLVEGALGSRSDGSVEALLANAGDSTASDRVVRVVDVDGREVDRTTVSLDPLDHVLRVLDEPADGPPVLETGDESVQAVET